MIHKGGHALGNISARNTLHAEMLPSVWSYVACCSQHATWFLGLERVSIRSNSVAANINVPPHKCIHCKYVIAK